MQFILPAGISTNRVIYFSPHYEPHVIKLDGFLRSVPENSGALKLRVIIDIAESELRALKGNVERLESMMLGTLQMIESER